MTNRHGHRRERPQHQGGVRVRLPCRRRQDAGQHPPEGDQHDEGDGRRTPSDLAAGLCQIDRLRAGVGAVLIVKRQRLEPLLALTSVELDQLGGISLGQRRRQPAHRPGWRSAGR